MPAPSVYRPSLSADKRKELESYLLHQYQRSEDARNEQLKDKFPRWQDIYYGKPFEETRNIPWYKSSNFIVKLVRIFADTFLARTLNILFATRPLYVVEGFPRKSREALEEYINLKSLRVWDHYNLTREFIHRGNKNGTCVIKTPWVERKQWVYDTSAADAQHSERFTTVYDGPKSVVVPFDDWNCYPITANSLDQVEINFHKVRYTEELVKRRVAEGKWQLDEDELLRGLTTPNDVTRLEENARTGINYYWYKELQTVECWLDYPITNDRDKYFPVVAVIAPALKRMIDCYIDPYSSTNASTSKNTKGVFTMYRPFPKEDMIFGESVSELLDQAQEEASAIHNDRRNNSTLANSVQYKRRSGSTVPNPSTNSYPGKVWDVESMDDLEVMDIGRNYNDMIQEEQFSIQLAQQLMGVSNEMIAGSAGKGGKNGTYNAMGTLAMMSEGNQRQDTNIRDVRMVLSAVAKASWILQKEFGADDPMIATLAPELAAQLTDAFTASSREQMTAMHFEAKASDSGANKEIRRQNLMQMAQVLGQYGQTVVQMSMQLANPQLNPVIRGTMLEVVTMMKGMADELLVAFDEGELEELVPDVERIMAQASQQQQQAGGFAGGGPGGPGQGAPMVGPPGGPGGGALPGSLAELQQIAALPGGAGGNT